MALSDLRRELVQEVGALPGDLAMDLRDAVLCLAQPVRRRKPEALGNGLASLISPARSRAGLFFGTKDDGVLMFGYESSYYFFCQLH